MGVELKLYVVDVCRGLSNDDFCHWAQIVGMVDLCVPDLGISGAIKKAREKTEVKVYFFPDGSTETTIDKYGSQLYAINPRPVFDWLRDEYAKTHYRRYGLAIKLLEGVFIDYPEATIMPYWY